MAEHLKTGEAIATFHEADLDTQKVLFPGLSPDHSGNTFSTSCTLAKIYIDRPELIEQMHGALCPLVGCKEYGCYAAYPDTDSASGEAHA
jgi:hypothetical protein